MSDTPTARAAFAQHTHDYLLDQIKFADQKAAFVFTAASALLAALYSDGTVASRPEALSTLSRVVGTALLAIAAACAAVVVVPRRKGSSRGYIFWAAIASYTNSGDYVNAVSALSEDDLTTETLHHCHELAHISRRKYASLAWALWTGASGAAVSVVYLIVTRR